MEEEEEEEDTILTKGKELFALCDAENKGFIIRNDLTRLGGQLLLSTEQLAVVFEGLDDDGNGYLTLEEFLEGFAGYLSVLDDNNKTITPKDESPKADDDQFEILLDHLGARSLFKDEEMVRAVWNHLKRRDSTLVLEFESFLGKISTELKHNLTETDSLRSALESKSSAYEDQIKTLYEEMELQIRSEKDKLLATERHKERCLREELEEKLQMKDLQLQELLNKQSEMQTKLSSLNSVEVVARETSGKLLKERESLQLQLQISRDAIADLRENLDFVRLQSKEEKRRRAKTAMNMSESIALEREELVKQLETLRVINKQLQDEKDEQLERYSNSQMEINEKSVPGETLFSPSDSGLASSHSSSTSKLMKRGSVMSNYILNSAFRSSPGIHSPFAFSVISTDDGIDVDKHNKTFRPLDIENKFTSFGKTSGNNNGSFRTYVRQETDPILGEITNPGVNPLMEEFLSSRPAESVSTAADEDEEELWNIQTHKQTLRKPLSITSRGEPVTQKIADPKRLFKVVFIGDSGVGKSSFIHRYCHHTFRATFSTTIGVDFQIKHVNCEGQTVVMQLWDTAGQERFRSITHQYMRKADGVVIMYDVTSETSFKNVRNWITSVRSTAEEDTVVLLIGNKLDMCSSRSHRAVKISDGMRLAEECYGLYFETSVKENVNVDESMQELAKRLREKQDLQLEKALHLHLSEKKKRCCY